MSISRPSWKRFAEFSIALAGVLFSSCSRTLSDATSEIGHKAAPEPIVVTVASLEPRSIQRRVTIVGSFLGREEVTISPEVDGRIARIHHDVGEVVQPGELLVEVDAINYELAAAEAEQAVAADLAKLGLEVLPEGPLDVKTIPTVERARLMVANTETKFQRTDSLARNNAVTKDELDKTRTEYTVAQAEFRQAELEARATLVSARHKQAMLQTARQRLKDTKIYAPAPTTNMAGTGIVPQYVVSERMVSEGEAVQSKPPTNLLKLVIDNPLKLVANVPERYQGDVKVGLSVEIAVEAYRDKLFEGKVSRVNPSVDRGSRTFKVEVLVENSAHLLKPGNFAKAAIIARQDDNAVTVPQESLVSFAGVNKVFVVRDNKSFAVEVEPGQRGDTWVEVSGKFPPGAQIVTSGHTKLADGTAIRVRGPSAGAAESSEQSAARHATTPTKSSTEEEPALLPPAESAFPASTSPVETGSEASLPEKSAATAPEARR
ncbi:MAG: efflux RND transporter periplasmic adaptor subunit [Planctomycetales bacterium]|nr:efflux RND transporter periplasmic adaptor subunit [Planctomycetales bacterium]